MLTEILLDCVSLQKDGKNAAKIPDQQEQLSFYIFLIGNCIYNSNYDGWRCIPQKKFVEGGSMHAMMLYFVAPAEILAHIAFTWQYIRSNMAHSCE